MKSSFVFIFACLMLLFSTAHAELDRDWIDAFEIELSETTKALDSEEITPDTW